MTTKNNSRNKVAQIGRVVARYDLERGGDVLLLNGNKRVARQSDHQPAKLDQIVLLKENKENKK